MTFISLRLKADHISEFLIGLVHSAFYMGFLIGSAKAEKLIKRIGYIRSFAAFASLYVSTVLMQGMYTDPYFWMFLRFLGGISISALYIVIESWLLVRGTAETRGKILSFYMIALYGSQSFSQLILQVINIETLIPFLIAGALGAISIIPVATTYTKSPEIAEEVPHKSLFEIIRLAPLGFWGCFMAGLILSSVYSFTPYFAQNYKLSVPAIMTITIAGGFILQWPIGHLSDIFDRRKVLIFTSFLIVIPSAFILFFPFLHLYVYILSFVLGGFCFTLYPLSITQVCDKIDPIYTTYATSLLSLVYGIGCVLGPIISPIFMKAAPSALYFYIGIVGVLLGIIGVYYKIKRPKRTAKKHKAEYVPLPATAPTASELDPRAPEELEKNPKK